MTDIDLLEDVTPASNEIGVITDLAQKMYSLEDEIAKLEEQLKQRKQDLKVLAEETIPDTMHELNLKDFTLRNGAKITIKEFIKASIPTQSAIDRAKDEDEKVKLKLLQQQGFDWLKANGAADLIKNTVEVQFGRDENEACNEFTEQLRENKTLYKRSMGVHPGTLSKFLQDRLENGKKVPMETFRVYTGRIANIRRTK